MDLKLYLRLFLVCWWCLMGKYKYVRDNWIITKSEFKQFVDNAELQQTKVMFILMYYTGARFTEILKLKTSNFIFDEDYITITIRNAKRQDNSVRQLKLPRGLYLFDYAEKYLKERDIRIKAGIATNELFDIKGKSAYNFFYYRLKKVCKSVDNPISFHAFRKSRATSIANKGHSANQIAGWLGHKTLNMSVYYIQNSTALTRDITESFKDG